MFSSLKKAAKVLRGADPVDAEIAYLNEAGDRFDLEHRQREIDRGMFRRNKHIGY